MDRRLQPEREAVSKSSGRKRPATSLFERSEASCWEAGPVHARRSLRGSELNQRERDDPESHARPSSGGRSILLNHTYAVSAFGGRIRLKPTLRAASQVVLLDAGAASGRLSSRDMPAEAGARTATARRQGGWQTDPQR